MQVDESCGTMMQIDESCENDDAGGRMLRERRRRGVGAAKTTIQVEEDRRNVNTGV